MNIDELFNELINLPKEDVMASARYDAGVVIKFLRDELKQDNYVISSFFFAYIALLMQADEKMKEEECELLNYVLGKNYSAKQIEDALPKIDSEEEVAIIDNIIDRLPKDVRINALRFGLAFLIIDGHATKEEKEIFARLLR